MTSYRVSILLFGLTVSIIASNVLADTSSQPMVATQQSEEQRAVLVTGATSGIGRNITELLAAQGHFVYAGGRKPEDIAELSAMENVEGVRLDVTVQSEIDAAVEHIRGQGRGLYGVVNNAGVGRFAEMNDVEESDIDFIFDVNVYGPYRINRAFTPLLTESQGRTLIIGSISGFLSGRQTGAYSMSKFAVEAYSESLAAEVADAGITVAVVEPGGYKSRIREKATRASLGIQGKDESELTDEQAALLERSRANNDALKAPDAVAEAVSHALFSDQPKFRYMVVPNEDQAKITVNTALKRAVQLNHDQPFAYSRDALVEMLDQLLKEIESPAAAEVTE